MLRESTVCLFCLNATAARIGLDKKGRPFFHCIACGVRAFLPSFSPCLNGVAILGPLARATADEMARDPAAWDAANAKVTALITEFRARARPATGEIPQPDVSPAEVNPNRSTNNETHG